MAKYRLLSAHYLEGDHWLPGDKENDQLGEQKGTIVGDGTPYKVKWPTLEMEPLDEEAEAMIGLEQARLATNEASMNPIEDMNLEDGWEKDFVPGFNTRRREPKPDGAPARMKK
jgi:hypothetical protein